MKIIFVSSEVVPFAKTGGLADVSGVLPQTFNELGHKCAIILPLYAHVKKNGFSPKKIKSNVKIQMGGREINYDICFLRHKNTDVYFIDNEDFFNRECLYGTPQGDYADNALRFAFFSRAVLEVIDYTGGVDVVHCNDWQSALVPLYLKLFSKKKLCKRSVFTIHNMAYQGVFGSEIMPQIDLPWEFFTPDKLEFYGNLNFMKAGIIYSGAVTTVSKGYAKEILTEEFGCGLDGLLKSRKSSLFGIINGADYEQWSPQKDKYIAVNFNEKTLSKKSECKKDLLKNFRLKYDEKKPVVGMITRLAEQKGIDLVVQIMEKMLSLGTYFVLLGTGDEKYNNLFKEIAKKHKSNTGISVAFDNALAHKIEAGSDIFLMPSRYEPCGLNQMYSLKYATIPVVRATGGLDDTIENFDLKQKKGNGFKFKEANAQALYQAIKKAVELYKNKKNWQILQKNALACDFSWEHSAREYIKLYNKIK